MEVNTYTPAGLKALNDHLTEESYISGYQPSVDDLTVFMTFAAPPPTEYKGITRWYKHVGALLSNSFPGPATGIKIAGASKPSTTNGKGNEKNQKKEKKAEKPKPKKAEEEKPKKAEPTAEEIRAKKVKAAVKEGGKKGQDIAGVHDMGGLDFFCTSIDAAEGDHELLKMALDGANVEVEEGSEERKGGSGHVGKCLYSSGLDALAITTYVPEDKAVKINVLQWMEHILKMTAGDAGVIVEQVGKTTVVAYIKQDADKNLFPLKMKDTALAQAIAYLRERDCFPPDDDDSDDDMVFGDDTDFDAL